MLNQNIKYICGLFPFVIFKREILTDVYRAAVTFFNSNRRDGIFFFSIIILCCIIGYCVISVSEAAIHNTLISKECLCDFMLSN